MTTTLALGNKSSNVWQFMNKLDCGKKAECKLCMKKLAFHGGTTNLHNHLRDVHPLQYKVASKEAVSFGPKQSKLTEFSRFAPSKSCPQERGNKIDDLIVNFIIKDMRPLNSVNGTGFQSLVKFFEPGYKLPSRTHLKHQVIQKYQRGKQILKERLTECEWLALTTDSWSNCNMESFITITAHFIDVDWKIKSCVLQTTNIGTTHTAENLANHLISIVEEDYEIPKEKICGVVHDNARNVMKMNEVLVEELECKSWQSISCAAHSLQLVVKAGLQVDAIQELVSSVRKLVGHFKHSTTAVSALQKEQVGMGIPQHKLKHDVATRWNSVLLMIERASEQRWAIAKVLGNSEITPKRQHRSLDLNQEQWELIQELVGILKPFEAATTLFCTEQQVSISCVYAVIVRMKSTLNSTDNEIPAIKKMKSQMKRKLEDLWNFNDIEKDCVSPLILSAALDPRFKTLQFLLPESIQKVGGIVLHF
jgi:zinc finger BED domain-containing protein 1 (E3 SUMO-protein ligase ZBED1)